MFDVHAAGGAVGVGVRLLGGGASPARFFEFFSQPVARAIMADRDAATDAAQRLVEAVGVSCVGAGVALGGGVEALRVVGVGDGRCAWERHQESLPQHGGPCGVGRCLPAGEHVAEPETGSPAGLALEAEVVGV